MSTPRAIASTRSSGRPTPIRYRGLCAGRCGRLDRRVHLGRRFADRQASDRVAREVELRELRRAARPEAGVESSLHDREERLIRTPGVLPATFGPADRAIARVADRGVGIGELHDVVEDHRHVAAQRFLDLDRALGDRSIVRPSMWLLEAGRPVRSPARCRPARRPESRRCRSGSVRPAGEGVQAAEFADDLFARAGR